MAPMAPPRRRAAWGRALALALAASMALASEALPSFPGGPGALSGAETLRLRGGFLKRFARAMPRFIKREYEFSAEEEAAFRETGKLMSYVSVGFFFHALFQSAMVIREVAHNGPPALLGFLDCADEMTYAWLIRAASSAFSMIAETEGNDLGHLMNAVGLQNRLWTKMRVPLMVKTIILFVGMIWSLFGEQIDASYGDTFREKMKGIAGSFARSVFLGMMKDMRRAFGNVVREFRTNVGRPFKPIGNLLNQAKANFKRNMLSQIDKLRRKVSRIKTDRKPSTDTRKINQEEPEAKPKQEKEQEKITKPERSGPRPTPLPPPRRVEPEANESEVEEDPPSELDEKLEELGRGG